MKRRCDLLVLTGWVLVFGLFVAFDAGALTRELRWTHPEPERLTFVFVIADGESVAEVPVGQPDSEGVFTTTVVVPFGSDVQIQVQDDEGMTSDLSNFQVYGDLCADFDNDGDGLVGASDFAWFRSEYRSGTASFDEFGLFRSQYGQTCL